MTDSPMKSRLLLICCLYAIAATAADTAITGTARNQTTGRPAAGDNVLLLRLGDGMQEETRTTTDAQGAFAINAAADARYIVRVMHQGVNYDQMVIGKGPLEIKVFDAVAKVPGMNGPLGIVQVESDGNGLKVTEMYSIRNASSPPVTQSSPHNFDIVLPGGASLDSAEVKSGESIWVNVSPAPWPGKEGRYTIDFPLRPGDTLFKFRYHLRHQGPATVRIKLAYPIQRFAVVHRPSMSFKALRPGTFKAPGTANGLQLEEAVAQPVTGEVPPFVVSESGPVPPSPAIAPAPAVSTPPPAAVLQGKPASIPPSEGSKSPGIAIWLVIPGVAAALAFGLLIVWRMRARKTTPMTAGGGDNRRQSKLDLDALKEELFHLEAQRLNGSLSTEQYDLARKALNNNIQRAMAGKSV